MGLFGRKRKAVVRGTARVVSLNHAPHATHGSLRATLVVEAPGVPAFTHVYKKFGARVDKWPDPGDVLPVEVDPADPTDVEVLWDDLPTARDERGAPGRTARRPAPAAAGAAGLGHRPVGCRPMRRRPGSATWSPSSSRCSRARW